MFCGDNKRILILLSSCPVFHGAQIIPLAYVLDKYNIALAEQWRQNIPLCISLCVCVYGCACVCVWRGRSQNKWTQKRELKLSSVLFCLCPFDEKHGSVGASEMLWTTLFTATKKKKFDCWREKSRYTTLCLNWKSCWFHTREHISKLFCKSHF